MLYNPNKGAAFLEEMKQTKHLCFQYNQLSPLMEEERDTLIRKIIGKCKESITIQSPFWCDYGRNIVVGEAFYANHNLVILDGARVTFGDNVFIAPNCCFSTAGHPLDAERRRQGLEYAHPIVVGNDVWIGAGVTVAPGVIIGDNTVIGAGSLVNKDIPSGVVAVGNPCRVLREITEEDKMEQYDSK